jgi:hypothetical protein
MSDELREMKALAEEQHKRALYAEQDNARLRALIKQAEFANKAETASGAGAFCPWCGIEDGHRDDCPAFTPEGEVK